MLQPLRILLIFWAVNIVAIAQESQSIEAKNGTGLFFVGAATQSYLSEHLYIGALYSNNRSFQFDPDHAMAMELRVLVPLLSSRTLSQIWNNSISINNSTVVLNQNLEQINQFIAILKDKFINDTPKFVAGDHIRFFYQPDSGTTILLNDSSLGTITGDTFFPILLNAWIGPVPPSTDFKESIQGKLNQKANQKTLLAHYKQLAPSPTRMAQIKQALQAAKNALQATENALRLEEEKRKEEARRQAAIVEKERLERERKKQERLKAQAALAIIGEKTLSKAEEKAEKTEEKTEMWEQERLREEYSIIVSNWIRSHQYYPRLALRKGHSGRVELLVRTDRNGNILSYHKEVGSGSTLLDNAAISALEKASPVPVMPASLEDEIFEFRLPLVYSIAEGN